MNPAIQRQWRRTVWVGVITWIAALAFCIALWLLGMGSRFHRLATARRELQTAETMVTQMTRDLTLLPRLTTDHAAAAEQLHSVTNRHLLVPENNFHDVRARFLLVPLAQTARFRIDQVHEVWRHPLPGGDPQSTNHYGRIGIEVVGAGSFPAIATFIANAERTMPYVTLSGLTVKEQRPTPETHQATLVFEWPLAGVPPPALPGKPPATQP